MRKVEPQQARRRFAGVLGRSGVALRSTVPPPVVGRFKPIMGEGAALASIGGRVRLRPVLFERKEIKD
jgi:hypothetical protein